MSLREAAADVMPDYSDIYKAEAEGFEKNLTAFQTGVKTYFDNLNADNNALADELKEAVSTTMANMSMGEVPDEAGMELFNNEINVLRQRLKNTPPGKKGELDRAKIRAEMERLKNSTDGMSETLIDLGVRVENGDFIPNATGNKNMEILKAINDRTAKREIINGDLVYSIPGSDKKITQQDLKKMLVSNDPEVNKAVHNVTAKAGTLGKTKGMEWDKNRQEIVNDYRESLSTKSGLAANMHQPQGPLKYSFADYLSGKGDKKYNIQIWNALKEAGVDVPKDKDGDGKITEKDFATPENGIAMIKRLTQIDEDGFDLAGTKNIVSEFLADHVGKKEFEDNRRTLGGDETQKYKIPGTAEWERWMKYNSENPVSTQPPFKDMSYGSEDGNKIGGQTLNDIWGAFYGGEITIDKIPYNRDPETNVWTNSEDQTTITGDKMLEMWQGKANSYNLLGSTHFKQFRGAASGGSGGKNPFGETQANRAPADFVTAVGKDDIDVVAYLKGMGITVTNKLGDKVEVEINGKTKTFTVDPIIATDENRANEMWKWMFESWGEIIRGGDGKNYIRLDDGTYKEVK